LQIVLNDAVGWIMWSSFSDDILSLSTVFDAARQEVVRRSRKLMSFFMPFALS